MDSLYARRPARPCAQLHTTSARLTGRARPAVIDVTRASGVEGPFDEGSHASANVRGSKGLMRTPAAPRAVMRSTSSPTAFAVRKITGVRAVAGCERSPGRRPSWEPEQISVLPKLGIAAREEKLISFQPFFFLSWPLTLLIQTEARKNKNITGHFNIAFICLRFTQINRHKLCLIRQKNVNKIALTFSKVSMSNRIHCPIYSRRSLVRLARPCSCVIEISLLEIFINPSCTNSFKMRKTVS